jgi:hypothetical protein
VAAVRRVPGTLDVRALSGISGPVAVKVQASLLACDMRPSLASS